MKRRLLGDAMDSFKWDYLLFLVEAMKCTLLGLRAAKGPKPVRSPRHLVRTKPTIE